MNRLNLMDGVKCKGYKRKRPESGTTVATGKTPRSVMKLTATVNTNNASRNASIHKYCLSVIHFINFTLMFNDMLEKSQFLRHD